MTGSTMGSSHFKPPYLFSSSYKSPAEVAGTGLPESFLWYLLYCFSGIVCSWWSYFAPTVPRSSPCAFLAPFAIMLFHRGWWLPSVSAPEFLGIQIPLLASWKVSICSSLSVLRCFCPDGHLSTAQYFSAEKFHWVRSPRSNPRSF